MSRFNDFNINENVLKAIEDIGFISPTKTQEMVLPKALKNKNIVCKGKTGSGKTHCFLIAIANKINVNENSLQALILVPTRELAIQLHKVSKEFFKSFNLKISLIIGGEDIETDINKVKNTPNIIIGTPSRINEIAINKGLINLASVKTLVIDEADMTLELGFLNELDKVAYLAKDAQMMLYSATIPKGLTQFINKYFGKPELIYDDSNNDNSNITHILYPARGKDKKEVLLKILENINPYICLVFANKKEEVNEIYEYLNNNSIKCGIIHGSLDARNRKNNIKNAIDGKYKIIICSDIAARGIDIDGVSHVISYNVPKYNLEFYVHRAGRAGRLNYKGESILLYDKDEIEAIRELKKQGINFISKEIKGNEWCEVKDFDYRTNRKNKNKKVNSELQEKINKTVNIHKSKVVKPNYKKKVKIEVEKVKRAHKREIIQKDIKKRIKERAISRNKGEL